MSDLSKSRNTPPPVVPLWFPCSKKRKTSSLKFAHPYKPCVAPVKLRQKLSAALPRPLFYKKATVLCPSQGCQPGRQFSQYCGWTKTILHYSETMETIVCWHLQGNPFFRFHRQDFVHPQHVPFQSKSRSMGSSDPRCAHSSRKWKQHKLERNVVRVV